MNEVNNGRVKVLGHPGLAPYREARLGPGGAAKRLSFEDNGQRLVWAEEARLQAILGGCKRSLASVRSGIRCYIAFIGVPVVPYVYTLGCACCVSVADKAFPGTRRYFPPELDHLLAWSTMFQSTGTLSNYFSYVKTACLVVRASTEVGRHGPW